MQRTAASTPPATAPEPSRLGSWRLWTMFFLGWLLFALAGCNSSAPYEFDEMDLMPIQDELVEFPLGNYTVPIPLVHATGEHDTVRRNRIELGFDLYALIGSDYRAELSDSWQRHEGKIRHRVIHVCRAASMDDLREPEFSTLKANLTDTVHAQLGHNGVRRLLLSEVVVREL